MLFGNVGNGNLNPLKRLLSSGLRKVVEIWNGNLGENYRNLSGVEIWRLAHRWEGTQPMDCIEFVKLYGFGANSSELLIQDYIVTVVKELPNL